MTTISAPHTTALTTELRYLALGDSYTIGEGVDATGRWPVQLAAALRTHGIDLADPRILATTGWTTDELWAAMDAAEPLGAWDFVSLLIGVNNQYRGRSVDDYVGEFHRLLRRAIALAGDRVDRVLVLSIPDWGVTPFAFAQSRDAGLVGAQVDAFNAVCREEAARAGAHWIDIAPVSRARGGEAGMLVDDGLHPSAAMYALWTAQALPAARQALGR